MNKIKYTEIIAGRDAIIATRNMPNLDAHSVYKILGMHCDFCNGHSKT